MWGINQTASHIRTNTHINFGGNSTHAHNKMHIDANTMTASRLSYNLALVTSKDMRQETPLYIVWKHVVHRVLPAHMQTLLSWEHWLEQRLVKP